MAGVSVTSQAGKLAARNPWLVVSVEYTQASIGQFLAGSAAVARKANVRLVGRRKLAVPRLGDKKPVQMSVSRALVQAFRDGDVVAIEGLPHNPQEASPGEILGIRPPLLEKLKALSFVGSVVITKRGVRATEQVQRTKQLRQQERQQHLTRQRLRRGLVSKAATA